MVAAVNAGALALGSGADLARLFPLSQKEGPLSSPSEYVKSAEIKAAVAGREGEVLDALGIDWRRTSGNRHIDCPYPEHGGKRDWRWDAKSAKAFCTCSKGHDIFEVMMRCEGIDFKEATLRVARDLGAESLIHKRPRVGGGAIRFDAKSLLAPPPRLRDDGLVRTYLAHRLGIDPAAVPFPTTACVGWKSLAYYEAGGEAVKNLGEFPCCVFETVAADGKKHAHRIYVAPHGRGKADLGTREDGTERDPKKSARKAENDNTSGRSTFWGDPKVAGWIIVAEGIETAAAVAHAFAAEISAGEACVAAAINAGGVAAFNPWPSTKRVTIAADRDEEPKDGRPPSFQGEKSARLFGSRQLSMPVDIALPGEPGTAADWLNVLLDHGADAVRDGILNAPRYQPTPAEEKLASDEARLARELDEARRVYPLPALDTLSVEMAHTKAGKVKVHKRTHRDGRDILTPVATPFGVPSRIRYVDQANAYGLRVVVQDMGGRPRLLDIDRASLAKTGGSEIKALLLGAGLRVEDDGDAIAVQCLKGADPDDEILVVRKSGWHELEGLPSPIFVCPDGTVLAAGATPSVELSTSARMPALIARKGTLDGWKAAVAAAVSVQGCEHWVVGLIAGFAGSLISLLNLDSCGLSFSGMSSAGKTTAQKLAASVWSRPSSHKESLFQSAKTSVNAMELTASRSTGTVLVLDELAHIEGKELGRLIYTLAGGAGKKRMTSEAAGRDVYSWSTFAVLSSERSLEERIRADKGEWTAGMAVRVVDIDVTGVNRRVPRGTMQGIEAVAAHYGHAGPAFVEQLIAAGLHEKADDIKSGIDALAAGFAGNADSAVLPAARPFAVLQMAGELALSFGILPEGLDISRATLWAWGRYRQSGDAAALDPVAHAIASLRASIAERWATSMHNLEGDNPSREAYGWYDREFVYISARRIVEMTGNALKEMEIARALDEANFIAKRKAKDVRFADYIPVIGRGVKVYVLPRSEFGREADADGDGRRFRSFARGRA